MSHGKDVRDELWERERGRRERRPAVFEAWGLPGTVHAPGAFRACRDLASRTRTAQR
jgi:hypothetical protein